MSSGWRSIGVGAAVTALWLLAAHRALPWLVPFVPKSVQLLVSFTTFRASVQLGMLVVFAGIWLLFVKDGQRRLGLRVASAKALAKTLLVAPISSVVSTSVALSVAMPTLMRELAERGAGASRSNAGAFGRELTSAPAGVIVLSAVLLAPVAEELLFRGAVFATVRDALREATRRTGCGLDIAAALTAATAFALMHADLPGGVGIVRVVSAFVLSVFSGAARVLTGSVVAPMALHAVHNLVALLQARGAFRQSALVLYVPAPLLVVACASAAALATWTALELRAATAGSRQR